MSGKDQPAPLPRDHDQASFSEMVPFRSKKIKIWKSPIFAFVLVTALFNVLMFTWRSAVLYGKNVDEQVAAFDTFVQVALFYMLSLSLLGIHAYSKTDKPIYFYLFPCLITYFFMESPLWGLIYPIFEAFTGGEAASKSDFFPIRLWAAFTGPGLREEFVKGIPALLGAALMVWAARTTAIPPRIASLLRVRTPLDGVLMGFASGCAFLFSETSGQYVHMVMRESFKRSGGNLQGAFGDALLLLLPRAMNGWVGHMAWAGIFGYFVGLAVIRRKDAVKLILGGWVLAALLHGLWDADTPGGNIALYVIGGVGGILAVACLVKARQLDASLFGRSSETFGSIVVSRPIAAAAPQMAAATPPAAAVFAPAAPPAAPAGSLGLVLNFKTCRLPLHRGAVLDLAAEPGLAGQGQGVHAEVTQHPTNPLVLGLKNLGATTWYARLRDNSVQAVEAQRSLRLSEGVSVDFGAGLVAVITAG